MTPNNNIPVVTIDGPSGSGKGTVARSLAELLDWHYLDSGAMYRVLALAAINANIDESNDAALVQLSQDLPMEFISKAGKWRVMLDNSDVTRDLRDEHVGQMASKISVHKPVRAALLALQRSFREAPGLITDGRDMGTVVFPDAPLKLFLEASSEIRAERRFKQLKEAGGSVSIDKICEDLIERDRRDRERTIAPTKPAEDAVIIDTSTMSAVRVFEKALQLVRNVLKGA